LTGETPQPPAIDYFVEKRNQDGKPRIVEVFIKLLNPARVHRSAIRTPVALHPKATSIILKVSQHISMTLQPLTLTAGTAIRLLPAIFLAFFN